LVPREIEAAVAGRPATNRVRTLRGPKALPYGSAPGLENENLIRTNATRNSRQSNCCAQGETQGQAPMSGDNN